MRHHDQPHPHAHLIVNRVTHEGKAINCGKSFRNSHDVCRELEKSYGLVNAGEKGEARIRALVERRALGEDGAVRLKVLDALDACLSRTPTSLNELATTLAREKVTPPPIFDNKQTLQAIVFTHEDHPGKWVKGSALRLCYGGEKLGETLVKNAEFAVSPPWAERNSSWALEQASASKYLLRNLDYVPSAREVAPAEELLPGLTGLQAMVERLERELAARTVPPTAQQVEQAGPREQAVPVLELPKPPIAQLEM